jgi:hypothetical protein
MAPEFIAFFILLALLSAAITAGGAILVVVLRRAPCVYERSRSRGARLRSTRTYLRVLAILCTTFLWVVLLIYGRWTYQQFFLHEPLEAAAGAGDLATVKRLLSRGASPNSLGVDFARPPIVAAASHGHRDIVQLLLEHGADPSLPDIEGHTAVSRAKQFGHEDIVLLLTNAGGNRR